jgi:hypothetical protein
LLFFTPRRALRISSTTPFASSSALAAPFVPGVAWSDHLPFWREGYPALMVNDMAFYRYRHYHAPTDTPEKPYYVQMACVVKTAAHQFRSVFSVAMKSRMGARSASNSGLVFCSSIV